MVYRIKMSIVCVVMGVVMGVFSTSLRAGEEAQVGDATQDTPTKGVSGETKTAVEAVPETAATSLDALVGQMNLAKAKMAPDPKNSPRWKRKGKSTKARALKKYESQLEAWRKQDQPNHQGKPVTWTLTYRGSKGRFKEGASLRLVSDEGNTAWTDKQTLPKSEYKKLKKGTRIRVTGVVQEFVEPSSPALGALVHLKNVKIVDTNVPRPVDTKKDMLTLDRMRIPARRVIYLLSTRGSMTDLFDGLCKQTCRSIESLSDTQQFQVLGFASKVTKLSKSYLQATPANKAKGVTLLKKTSAMGQGDKGLARALKAVLPFRRKGTVVVLFCHGQSDSPESVLATARRIRVPVYVFDYGIAGSEESKLLLQIAELTSGRYVYAMQD
jgi:hypothetical protein